MNIIFIVNFPDYLDGRRSMGRFTYLAEMLSNRGHQIEMIVSDFDHNSKKHRLSNSINYTAYGTKIKVLHETGYPNNISIKRLWSHYVWGKNVERYINSITKPDALYCAVPSLTAGVRAAKFCKKNNVKFIVDVQDLWPEAFYMIVKNVILQKLFLPIEWYVNIIYKQADSVIAVSESYAKRALQVNKKTNNGICVYLGNDGELFDSARENGIKTISEDELYLCYIGTMGYSYDIPCVLKALTIYKHLKGLPQIKFIAIGGGPLLDSFKQMAANLKVDCEFTGPLNYIDMVKRMCTCDIVVNPIVKGGAQSITNKVGDYALSGLPVVSTQENQEYRDLVNTYKCGINCECGNPQSVANALEILAKNPALRKELGENARKLGVERFDRRETYKQIVQIIEQE